MDIPTGEPVERGREIPNIDPENYISRLMDEDFTGYSAITIHGETGLEEGVIVYHNGEIRASDYLYFRYDEECKVKDGLERSLNALRSENGIIDTYKLSSHQLQLVITLNEESVIEKPISKEELEIPESFSIYYEEQLMEEETKELSRNQLLKKYGLTALSSSKDTAGQLVQKAREEHRTLEDFLEKERKK